MESDKNSAELIETIKNEIRDISASCLSDLTMISTGTDALTDIITHEILVYPDTKPIKQKTRGIPQININHFGLRPMQVNTVLEAFYRSKVISIGILLHFLANIYHELNVTIRFLNGNF